MKTFLLSAGTALILSAAAWAADPPSVPTAAPAAPAAPAATAALSARIEKLEAQLRTATDDLAAVRKRLDTVEKRLGDSYRAVSSFDTIERRLEDLRKDVDDLERRR